MHGGIVGCAADQREQGWRAGFKAGHGNFICQLSAALVSSPASSVRWHRWLPCHQKGPGLSVEKWSTETYCWVSVALVSLPASGRKQHWLPCHQQGELCCNCSSQVQLPVIRCLFVRVVVVFCTFGHCGIISPQNCHVIIGYHAGVRTSCRCIRADPISTNCKTAAAAV